MTVKHALPGLAAGTLGLIVGVIGFVTGEAFAGVLAGLFALAAAAGCVRLASRLEDEALLRSRLDEAENEATELRGAQRPAAQPSDVDDEANASAEIEGQLDEDSGNDEQVGLDAEIEIDVEGSGEGGGALADGTDESDGEVSTLLDPTTGLFSESFFHVALENRIAAARRHLRPVAVVLVDVVSGLPEGEPVPVEAFPVADTLKETLREADTACRLHNGYFALLLEDTPETGAIWTVERIRRQLVATQEGVTVWAGVACYPAHAFTPEGILDAAGNALVAAREWRQDRIEIAAVAE
jgi:GGDEF domain-containing protein